MTFILSPSCPSRRAAVAALAVVGVLALPTVAAADEVTAITVDRDDAIVDVPLGIQVYGTVDSDSFVHASINPATTPCAASHELNAPNQLTHQFTVVPPGALEGRRFDELTLDRAGDYTVCVYVERPYGTTQARAAQAVRVREPRVSLSLGLAGAATAGAIAPLRTTTDVEIPRLLWVEVNPDGVACAPDLRSNGGAEAIAARRLVGGPITTTDDVRMPPVPGLYHLCGYVGRNSVPPVAPLVVVDSGPFAVAPAPTAAPPVSPPASAPPKRSCTVAPRTVAARSRIRIRCRNVAGRVEIRATRGGRHVRLTRRLVRGTVTVRARALRLRRGTTRVSVRQGGATLGARAVRRR